MQEAMQIDFVRGLISLHGKGGYEFPSGFEAIAKSLYRTFASYGSELCKRALQKLNFDLTGPYPYSDDVMQCISLMSEYELGWRDPPPRFYHRSKRKDRIKTLTSVFSPSEMREMGMLSRQFHETLLRI